MSNVKDLAIKKDGMALKALALEGDHEAGLAFAELVFDAKYIGDKAAIAAKTVTKKDELEKARQDAFAFVEAGAESDYLSAVIRKAEIKFQGVREPGPHGSRLVGALYGESEALYKALLEHPECPEDRRGEFLIYQAQSIDFKARIKGLDRREEVIALLEQALNAGDSQELAHYILSGIRWKEGQYEKAVSHAKACSEAHPYALLTLQKASKDGLGMEKDEGQAAHYYQLWFEKTESKRRSK